MSDCSRPSSLPKTKLGPKGIFPESYRQPKSWECGYYVMKWMMDIVFTSIVTDWNDNFCDRMSLSNEELNARP